MPPSDIRELITHFYRQALGRDPEPGAVDAWETGYFQYALQFDIDVRFIPREMGRLFFLSDEYAARGRSVSEFITDCYLTFLFRYPSQGELDAWLGGAWEQSQALSIFAESEEFGIYLQSTFPGLEGDPVRNFVTRLYIGLLDRLVDSGGLAWWVEQLSTSADPKEGTRRMARAVLRSEEFLAAQPTDGEVVTRLYRALLGRFPNGVERAAWVEELSSGRLTADDLVDFFTDSEEFALLLGAAFP